MNMDGILIVDKPKGMTSHDVVDFLRRRFGLKKVGHAGTLDPMATGVLVMLIGKYTKFSNHFTADDKEYEGTLTLGGTSDTGDAQGRITRSEDPVYPDRAAIEAVFAKFTGDIMQSPPMYSAVKVKGKKLYELARKGMSIAVEPKKICVKRLEINKVSMPEVSFSVACSKGTYIRQLAVDIGSELGCGAYLSSLRRTRSGRFDIKDAVTIEELKNTAGGELEKRLIAI